MAPLLNRRPARELRSISVMRQNCCLNGSKAIETALNSGYSLVLMEFNRERSICISESLPRIDTSSISPRCQATTNLLLHKLVSL